MTDRCPIHDRPLVIEHTSRKKICIPCVFEKANKARNEPTPKQKAAARLKDWRQRVRADKQAEKAQS